MWSITFEPLNAEDTVWLVTCAETADNEGDPSGEVALRVKGDRAQAEIEGKRKIAEVLEIRESRARLETIQIDIDTIKNAPAPGASPAEIERRKLGLERTKQVREELVGEMANLQEQLLNAQTKMQVLDVSIAAEEADLGKG